MEEIRNLTVPAEQRYGPLAAGFRYDLRSGYTSLVGPNNAGKSALLQWIFRALIDDSEFGGERICLILPDRSYVDPTTETGGRTLAQWNMELLQQLGGTPLQHTTGQGPIRSELAKLLLHGSLIPQMRKLRQDGAVAPRATASDSLARLVGAYASVVGRRGVPGRATYGGRRPCTSLRR